MHLNNIKIHLVIWLAIVFFPSLKWTSGGSALGQKAMHALVICLVVFLFLVTCFRRRPMFEVQSLETRLLMKHYRQFLLYFSVMAAYATFVFVFIADNRSGADLSDILRPFVYFAYLSIPLMWPLSYDELRKLVRYLFVLLWIQVVLSAFVYFPALWPVIDIFKGRMSDDVVFYHFLRWSGTFIYPSDFSFFVSFFVYYMLYMTSFSVEKAKYVLGLVLLFAVVILTLSRGGLASIVFMMMIFYVTTKAKRSFAINSSVLVVGVIVSVGVAYMVGSEQFSTLNPEYLLSVFDEDGPDDSTLHRIKEAKLALHYSVEYFPFGAGGNRQELAEQVGVVESYYGHNLIRGGWIGLAMSLLLFIFLPFYAFQTLSKLGDIKLRAFVFASVLLVISVPLVFGFSSAMSDRFKCLPFFYLLYGYVLMLGCGRSQFEGGCDVPKVSNR